jgi:non-heme chloroperoxidase
MRGLRKASSLLTTAPLALRSASGEKYVLRTYSSFDGFQAQLAANRAQFYYDVPAGPFFGYNRPGAKPSQG